MISAMMSTEYTEPMHEADWAEMLAWCKRIEEESSGWADRIDPQRSFDEGRARYLDRISRDARHLYHYLLA